MMYARKKGTTVVGDVNYRDPRMIRGTLMRTQRPFSWKIGRGNIELIEFGSFNPEKKNYRPGGKVIEVV